jgi:hypothetical protein
MQEVVSVSTAQLETERNMYYRVLNNTMSLLF